MKIKFYKIETKHRNIEVSFDGGLTFESHNKNAALNDGIEIPDSCYDFSQIIVKAGENQVLDLWYELPNTDERTLENILYNNQLDSRIKKLKFPEGTNILDLGSGSLCLYECENITDISLSNRFDKVKFMLFDNNTHVKNVYLPNSITEIESSAFSGCTSLENINIPDSVISIGRSAFAGCSSLTNITLPNTITSIGEYAFAGCSSLTSINIPDGCSVGRYAFNGTPLQNEIETD